MTTSPEEFAALADPEAAALSSATSIGPVALGPAPPAAPWRALRHAAPSAWFGLLVIILYAAVAIFAPLFAPFGQAQVVAGPYEPWSHQFFFGTDQLGRDMFSRLIYGARNTVGIALITTCLAFMLGGMCGLVAATVGGWTDLVLARLVCRGSYADMSNE